MSETSIDATERPTPFLGGPGRRFIDLAALGRNTWRTYLVGLLRIVFYPIVFSVLVFVILTWALYGTRRQVPPLAVVVALFGPVIMAGVAVVQTVARTHRRPWLSVVSPDFRIDWRRLAIGAGVEGAIGGVLLVVYVVAGQPSPFASAAGFPVLALSALLIPLQSASEEILFRGYLTQALGRVFRSRVKIVTSVAIVFAALHFNSYGLLTMPYMFVLSVLLSLVSLRDGRLELTIGAHAANNWLDLGMIGSFAYGHAMPQVSWLHLPFLAVQCVLLYWLTGVLVRRFCAEPILR